VKILMWLSINFGAKANLKEKYAKSGSWAVITGASEGIGRGFALDLARRGFNVVLLARTKAKLDDVASECGKYNVGAKVIPFDFAVASENDYDKLFAELDDLAISILVNNVGVILDATDTYDTGSIDCELRLLKVNCESQLRMTKYVLPKMKAKRCGAVISLSSAAALLRPPFLSTYAATKAFNLGFSESLALEMAEYGIDVLAVTPSYVTSAMTNHKRESFDTVPSLPMAKQSLDQLGLMSKTAGHWRHRFMIAVLTHLPTSLLNYLMLSNMKVARSKLAAKKQKQSAQASGRCDKKAAD